MKAKNLTSLAVCIGICTSGSLELQGCGLGDLFRAAGPRDVQIQFIGTSSLSVGDSLPFQFAVSANGITLADPDLTVESSDTLVVALTATRDSLLALRTGSVLVTAQLHDPEFTDSLPTLAVKIRVRGGSGP